MSGSDEDPDSWWGCGGVSNGTQTHRENDPQSPCLTQQPPLSIPDTTGLHILDLSGELSDALGQIFDSQQGCDLFIQVTGQGYEDLSLCAHTLILRTNPEAQALWQVVGSSVIMRVDAECMPVVRDFLR